MASLHQGAEEEGAPEPAHFGQYSVVREIGRGGMARVYEGRHPHLGTRVALKVMEPILAAQTNAAARFLREAKAASQIRHPNVVQVFDTGTQQGVPFIVMEYLEGSDLATLIAKKGAMPLSGIVDIFLPVISAVTTAHRAGIIHRDLKPANVVLTQRAPLGAHPMILDFGISKIMSEERDGSVTGSESLLGTAQYMAPELTRGARFATTSSDQYALGVMLYECATGRRPFSGESAYELMHAAVTATVAPPSQITPSLPSEFDALVLRAMSRDPAKRYPTVQALGSALLSFGSKTAWALWERDIVGAGLRGGDPWASDAGTLRDAVTPPSAQSAERAARHRGRGYRGLAAGALVAYSALMTILAWCGAPERTASRQAPPSTAPTALLALTAPTPTNAPAEALAPSSAPLVPTIAVPSNDPPPAGSSERSYSRPSAKPPTRPSHGPIPANAPSAVGAPSSKRSPDVGTNGAPIVD